jgi:CheY-like chemotaxis protein
VEDNRLNQVVMTTILRKRGHSVSVAWNGAEGVAALESGSFDVVLMDVQMPVMDGLEAAAAIRAKERESGGYIPIIAMTAHTLKEDVERCKAVGMDGYISKPLQLDRLSRELERVRNLRIRRQLTQTS